MADGSRRTRERERERCIEYREPTQLGFSIYPLPSLPLASFFSLPPHSTIGYTAVPRTVAGGMFPSLTQTKVGISPLSRALACFHPHHPAGFHGTHSPLSTPFLPLFQVASQSIPAVVWSRESPLLLLGPGGGAAIRDRPFSRSLFSGAAAKPRIAIECRLSSFFCPRVSNKK